MYVYIHDIHNLSIYIHTHTHVPAATAQMKSVFRTIFSSVDKIDEVDGYKERGGKWLDG